MQGEPRDLHPLVRDEAFRHADAQRIDVEIRYEARRLQVRVHDDGKGIEPEVPRSGRRQGHFGLSGMREHAKLAGGKLMIRSGPDTGTEVEFTAPGSRAYSASLPARSRLLPRKFAPSEIDE